MHMFCSTWSIVPPYEFRLRSFMRECWIVLPTVRKGYVRVNFVVWGIKGKSVSIVFSRKFIAVRTDFAGVSASFFICNS